MFSLLSFLTFGETNDRNDLDTATRSTISAMAFKVSAAAAYLLRF
jgi:hypothetical protein